MTRIPYRTRSQYDALGWLILAGMVLALSLVIYA